jgi:hypothetical protein
VLYIWHKNLTLEFRCESSAQKSRLNQSNPTKRLEHEEVKGGIDSKLLSDFLQKFNSSSGTTIFCKVHFRQNLAVNENTSMCSVNPNKFWKIMWSL